MKRCRVVTRSICIVLLVAGGLGRLGAAEQPPNFVVILTDDQSWVGSSALMDPNDSRSKSNYYRTPHIQRLTKMGTRFVRGYSPAPFCCPTRRSLLIGQTPARHIYQQDQPGWATRYRQQLSLPQALKAANPDYRTAHFGKWDARFDNVTPQEMGYDYSDGLTGNDTGGGKGDGGPAAKDDPKLIFDLTNRSVEFMQRESAAGNPFFLQLSHYAVHLDIFYRQSTLDQVRKWKPDRRHSLPEFAAMTGDVDAGIGQLLDKIESLGLSETTYIFFMSDNGGRSELPNQQGRTLPRNHPLRDGKGSMYEGGIRVPFIVCGPGIKQDCVSRVPVTGLDIFPTIVELAGHHQPLPKTLDGGSMVSLLRGGGLGTVQRNRPFLLFHQAVARKAQTAIIQGNWKLVKTWDEQRTELFDLSSDVSEANDLSKAMPDKTQNLHRLMEGFLDEVGAEKTRSMTKDQQKALFTRPEPTTAGASDVNTIRRQDH